MNHRNGPGAGRIANAVIAAPFDRRLRPITLLAVCPVSEAVVEANLRAASTAGAPAIFTTTLNQVDVDGGYTGWTPQTFVSFTRALAARVAPELPVLFAADHAGPWKKDVHAQQGLSLAETLTRVRDSLQAYLDAGYCWVHLDTTSSANSETPLSPESLAEHTAALLGFCEKARPHNAKICYEVGVEEAGGVVKPEERLRAFLAHLTNHLRDKHLPIPTFAVGDLGTRLDGHTFDEKRASQVVAVARSFDMGIKAHYSDDLRHPNRYPSIGISAANVGPGLAGVEVDVLTQLEERSGVVAKNSGFTQALYQALDESGRWRKWVSDEGSISDLGDVPEKTRSRLVRSCSRYVLSTERVRAARRELLDAVGRYSGVDPQRVVVARLETALMRFYQSFNLIGLTDRLNEPT